MAGEPEDSETSCAGCTGPTSRSSGCRGPNSTRSTGSTWCSSARRSTAGPRTGRGPGSGRRRMRITDYLPHDASRPHLALGVDPLVELRVRRRRRRDDAAGRDREVAAAAGETRCTRWPGGRHPGHPGRRPHGHAPRRHRGGPARRLGPGVADPLRRARRHRRHPVRVAVRARHADAAADRVRRGARGPVPADRAARVLARAAHAGLDGRAADALVRDERDRDARVWTTA